MPQKDPEQRKAYMKEWAEKNQDKIRANRKRYEQRNAEKIKGYQKAYYQKNREKVLKREAERQQDPAVRQRKRDNVRAWREKNPERARETARRGHAKRVYGLTLEEYEAILARGCAICGGQDRLCLDHDHANGKIRDALCKDCNVGIGSLGDDPVRLHAAARYVERHRKQS